MKKDQLHKELGEAEKNFRAAIRWLMDADRFYHLFKPEDWRDDFFKTIADISEKTRMEAAIDVMKYRIEILGIKKKLKDLDHEDI